ncbi:MAG: hypothetical protein ACK49I_11000 [Verrucomicrobiota bacterium]
MKNIPLIRHESWNLLVDTISRRLPLRFEAGPNPRKWSHPWKISPFWDEEDGKWLFKIKPGFVNGVEVTIPTRVKNASERTISRLTEADEDIKGPDWVVNAFLSEWPRVDVGETRIIGTGANPTGTLGSGSSTQISYEGVPKFFADLGVTSANTQLSGDLETGFRFIKGQEDATKARRLRACDISLWKDRQSAKIELYPGSTLEGITGAIYITYSHSGGMRKNPYLRISSRFVPPKKPESTMDTLMGVNDPEYDVTKMATIFFLSQPGVDPEAPLDETWTPYVKYDHFWNLAHSPQSIPDLTPIEPIMLITGLAGGVADGLIGNILAPFNNQLNQALQILKGRNLEGAFWSL